jgi:hypothetical protein
MKLNLLLALAITSLTACLSDDKVNVPNSPVENKKEMEPVTDESKFTTIQWMDSVKNLPPVNEGAKVEINYKFKNTGNMPLVIESAVPGCGCTVAEKPEQPIMPGQEGNIKGVFDTEGKAGDVHKNITVKANTKGTQSHVLLFNMTVNAKPKNGVANLPK